MLNNLWYFPRNNGLGHQASAHLSMSTVGIVLCTDSEALYLILGCILDNGWKWGFLIQETFVIKGIKNTLHASMSLICLSKCFKKAVHQILLLLVPPVGASCFLHQSFNVWGNYLEDVKPICAPHLHHKASGANWECGAEKHWGGYQLRRV